METGVTCYETYPQEAVEQQEEIQVSDAPDIGLGESVSFGRFSLDPFSWMKRSSFNHNQYLEELENCSASGSVAQKKAYFEAYYKALAKKKALEQALAEGSSVAEGYSSEGMDDGSIAAQRGEFLSITGNMKEVPSSAEKELRVVNEMVLGENLEGDSGTKADKVESISSLQVDAAPEVPVGEVIPQLSKDKEENTIVPCVQKLEGKVSDSIDEVTQKLMQEVDSNTSEDKSGDRKDAKIQDKFEVIKQSNQKIHQKTGLKESSTPSTLKKVGLTMSKSRPVPVQKPSESVSGVSKVRLSHATSAAEEVNSGSVTKADGEVTPKRKRGAAGTTEVKGMNSGLSVRQSLNGGSSRSNFTVPQPFALATDKRASMAGQLSDREVTRITIKPVGSSFLPASSSSKKTQAGLHQDIKDVHKLNMLSKSTDIQVSKKVEQKASADKGESMKQLEESTKSRKSQAELKQSNDIIMLHHEASKSGKAKASQVRASANTFTFKSDLRAERRKEFNSKLEERLTAKEAEKYEAQAQTKDEIEAEIKQLRKSLTFKATPMPTFYQDSAPPKQEIKKIPPTRAKSPKLGRKNADIDSKSGGSTHTANSEQDNKVNGILVKSSEFTEKGAETVQSKDTASVSKKIIKKNSMPNLSSQKGSRITSSSMAEGEKLKEFNSSSRLENDSVIGELKASNLSQDFSHDECNGKVNGAVLESSSAQFNEGAMADDKASDAKRPDANIPQLTVNPKEEPVNTCNVISKGGQSKREEIKAAVMVPSSSDGARSKRNKGLQHNLQNETQDIKDRGIKAAKKERAKVAAPVFSSSKREQIGSGSSKRITKVSQELSPATPIVADVAVAS